MLFSEFSTLARTVVEKHFREDLAEFEEDGDDYLSQLNQAPPAFTTQPGRRESDVGTGHLSAAWQVALVEVHRWAKDPAAAASLKELARRLERALATTPDLAADPATLAAEIVATVANANGLARL